MSDYSIYSDNDLLDIFLKDHQRALESDMEDLDAIDDVEDAKLELMRRLFVSRVGVGLLTAISNGVDSFSDFDEQGFKKPADQLQQILHHIHSHVGLIHDVIDGNIDVDDAKAIVDRNINSYGEIIEDEEDDESEQEDD
jgi:hypothetical protein